MNDQNQMEKIIEVKVKQMYVSLINRVQIIYHLKFLENIK